ncbi:hypothetical protein ACU610_01985 [Geodermatophilus sp. URMC 61]|uniref:hypothetical protein n=1 Tax=Geodermatophilus sp. URMC 61 TaxID=3423411 RepID=UPI00406D159D
MHGGPVPALGVGGRFAAVDLGRRAASALSRLSTGTGGVWVRPRSRRAWRSRRSAGARLGPKRTT